MEFNSAFKGLKTLRYCKDFPTLLFFHLRVISIFTPVNLLNLSVLHHTDVFSVVLIFSARFTYVTVTY